MAEPSRSPVPGGVSQPWNQVVWPDDPSVASSWSTWRPMTPWLAKSLPAVARAIHLITGQPMQMPLDDYRGVQPQPRPRLLEQPDPDQSRAWFVEVQWEDYLVNGNAVHYVTTRNVDAMPATVVWVPAEWINLTYDPVTREVDYWVGGTKLRRADVVHVKRGSSRLAPYRGVGVVEQHMETLGVVADQQSYEREVLRGAAVPSVAVIAPNPVISQTEADEAKSDWLEKYGGPKREPAILPFGSQVIPLSWSPSDAQLIEAQQQSLTDVANMFNLDSYWLGAPGSSHTYRSPGPMFLNLLRQTVGPILEVFEDVWSSAWLPRGHRVRHDRKAVLLDDMQTTVNTMRAAVSGGLMTVEEARTYMGLQPELPASAASPTTSTSTFATVENDNPDPAADPAPVDDGGRSFVVNVTGDIDPEELSRAIQKVLRRRAS